MQINLQKSVILDCIIKICITLFIYIFRIPKKTRQVFRLKEARY